MGKYYKIPWLSDFYRFLNRLIWNSLFFKHFKIHNSGGLTFKPPKSKLLWITHKETMKRTTKSCYLRIFLDNINILFVLYFDWKFEHGLVSIWCPAAIHFIIKKRVLILYSKQVLIKRLGVSLNVPAYFFTNLSMKTYSCWH